MVIDVKWIGGQKTMSAIRQWFRCAVTCPHLYLSVCNSFSTLSFTFLLCYLAVSCLFFWSFEVWDACTSILAFNALLKCTMSLFPRPHFQVRGHELQPQRAHTCWFILQQTVANINAQTDMALQCTALINAYGTPLSNGTVKTLQIEAEYGMW